MDIDKAIQGRHSSRKFKEKKPDWRDILECIDAARFAPMAGGSYSLKFILVDDKEKIQQIADSCQQDFVGAVHYIVVACSVIGRTVNAYGKAGEIYARQQAGAAMENFLLSIEDHGLATCWVGYFVESMIKETLRIPSEIQVEAVFPIGFESEKRKAKKTKIEHNNILYFNSYGQKGMDVPRRMNV